MSENSIYRLVLVGICAAAVVLLVGTFQACGSCDTQDLRNCVETCVHGGGEPAECRAACEVEQR